MIFQREWIQITTLRRKERRSFRNRSWISSTRMRFWTPILWLAPTSKKMQMLSSNLFGIGTNISPTSTQSSLCFRSLPFLLRFLANSRFMSESWAFSRQLSRQCLEFLNSTWITKERTQKGSRLCSFWCGSGATYSNFITTPQMMAL